MLTITPTPDKRYRLTRSPATQSAGLSRAQAIHQLIDHGLRAEEATALLELTGALGTLTLLPTPPRAPHRNP
ncbi:hypothetical protein [Actinomadura violacea]|uniref:Uncharacterized protein n=1 Tax=Actinomadura violacea TaxID=2819934 RepID=A0ABS3S9R7_9ACTN|nr:hypothetical protein [Actinomadura violacea]MBO2464965.1 hypothetical protein [Actinomadura violacea]